MEKKRNLNLDLVRVVSCFAVIGLHTFLCDVSFINSVLYYLCGFAVEAFFMASGYILANRKEIPFRNTLRKIGNILIVVTLWNGGLFIVKFSYKVILHHDNSYPVYDIFLMIGKSLIQKDTMFHFWYFGALILIYLVIYVITKLQCTEKAKKIIWITALVICVGIQTGSIIMGEPLQKHLPQTFRLWTWVQYFLLGGLTAGWSEKIYLRVSLKLHTGIFCAVCIMIPLYQYYMGNHVIGNAHAEYFYDDILTIVWVFLLFTLLMRLKLSERVCKAVQCIAPCTMGMYIIHPLLIKGISHFIALNSIVVCTGAFLVILAFSFGMTYIMLKIPVVRKLVIL